MSKVAFLYNTSHPQDALVNWVLTLKRHVRKHEVELLLREPYDRPEPGYRGMSHMIPGEWPDYTFALTASCYPTKELDDDLERARDFSKIAVLHNEDWGIPTPGKYPSFCWTETAQKNLVGYNAILCSQPVFPRLQEPRQWPMIHVGTFGHCDPKKGILAMARRLNQLQVPFTVFCPLTLHERYKEYADLVARAGADVVIHPWREKVEELAEYFDRAEISHFLFNVGPSKGGTGGSPTGPRYATLFGRPVLIVDDEAQSGELNVVESLAELSKECFQKARHPLYKWTPDRYLDVLCHHTDCYCKGGS